MENQNAELMCIYKKELNSKAKERILAVLNVTEENKTISTIARLFYKSYNTIKNWVMRFKEFGVAGLYEKPRSGRPPKITNHKITEFFTNVKNGIFPKQFVHKIKKDTGVKYTESGIRDMLRRHNFTPNVPDSTHKNKASNEQIEEWQKSLKWWISCVKRDGFEMYVQDETILTHDYVTKRGPWSPVGQKILRVYFGDHQRRIIYGAISDSHQYFLQKKKFNGSTFLKFVKKLLELCDKVAIVMDAASQHRTKEFKKFVKANSSRLRIMYLPTGCPEFSAIEEYWHQLKIQPFMYEHHEHVSDRARAAMKYLRTAAFSQNIEQYLFRKPIAKTF